MTFSELRVILSLLMNIRFSLYLLGDKPRVVSLIVVTAALGYLLGERFTGVDANSLWPMLLGVTLSASGASVLNQVIERDTDAKMKRTMLRAVPTGVVPVHEALAVGVLLVFASVLFLWWSVNLLTAFLALMTAFLYVCVYTPLKRITWLNTVVGAIPGALPALGGYTAATGETGVAGWLLFAIVFLWQHPHFYAIAWMYKDDYARGGLKMLPVVEPDGAATIRQIALFTALLILCSLYPAFAGWVGVWYVAIALAAGLFLVVPAWRFARERSFGAARGLLRGSLLYLPIVLTLIAVDVTGA